MNVFSVIQDASTGQLFAVVVQKKLGIAAIGISTSGKQWARQASRQYSTIADVVSNIDIAYTVSSPTELSDSSLVSYDGLIDIETQQRMLSHIDRSMSFVHNSAKHDVKTLRRDISDIPLLLTPPSSRSMVLNFKAASFRRDITVSSDVFTAKSINKTSFTLNDISYKALRTRGLTARFDPNAVDADADGLVQEGTTYQRPGTNVRKPNQIGQRMYAPKPVSMYDGYSDSELEDEIRKLQAQRVRNPKDPNGVMLTLAMSEYRKRKGVNVPQQTVGNGGRAKRRGITTTTPRTRSTTTNVQTTTRTGTPQSRTVVNPPAAPVPNRQVRGTAPKKKIRDRVRDRLETFGDDIGTPGAVTQRRKARKATRKATRQAGKTTSKTPRKTRGTKPAKASGAAAKPKRRSLLQTLEDFSTNISTPGAVTAGRQDRRAARRQYRQAKKGRGAKRTATTRQPKYISSTLPAAGRKVNGTSVPWASLSDKQRADVKKEAIDSFVKLEATWIKRLGKNTGDPIDWQEIEDYIDMKEKSGASQAYLGVLKADYRDAMYFADMYQTDDFSKIDNIGPTRRKAILTDAKALVGTRNKPKAKAKPKKKPAPVAPAPTPAPKPAPKPKKPAPKKPAAPKPTPAKPRTPKPKPPVVPAPTPRVPSPTGKTAGGVAMPTLDDITKNWTKTTGPLGSNGGQWYQDPVSGRKVLVKPTQSADHANNEAAMSAFYRATGVKVPNVVADVDGSGNNFVISEFVDFKPWSGSKADQKTARDHMGLDMLVSNWDAFGAGGQNVGVDANGNIVRVDNGGAGKFRAQGVAKPEFDTGKPWKDPSTMIDSPFGKDMYGDVTNGDIAAAMLQASEIDLDSIDDEMTAAGVDAKTRKEIIDVLRERQQIAAQLHADFVKYDPKAKPVTGTGKQIAPGGNVVKPSARANTSAKKTSNISNPADRGKPARKRAIASIGKLLERNRQGSAFGENPTKPKTTKTVIDSLANLGNTMGARPASADQIMETVYGMHGFSDAPIQATEAEVQELIDAGWTVRLRGVVDGTNGIKVDPTNPNQTWNQKMVWGWLAGKRFFSGNGGNGANFGPGDYFATPNGASQGWSYYHSSTPSVNGLQNNATIMMLYPPTAKIITDTESQKIHSAYQRHFSAINGLINPQYGSNKNATVAQMEAALPKGARKNQLTSIYIDLLDNKIKAKTPADKKKADDALKAFQQITGQGHHGFSTMLLGYDGIEHTNSTGVTTFFNRSNAVVLGEATNLQAAKAIINKTAKSKTDPTLQM